MCWGFSSMVEHLSTRGRRFSPHHQKEKKSTRNAIAVDNLMLSDLSVLFLIQSTA